MLVVEYEGKFWLVNPIKNQIEGPFDSLDQLMCSLDEYMRKNYSVDPFEALEFTGPFADHAAIGYAGPPWYTDPGAAQRVADHIHHYTPFDHTDVFPPGVVPPTPSEFPPDMPFWERFWILYGRSAGMYPGGGM